MHAQPRKNLGVLQKIFGLEEVGLARSGVYPLDGKIDLAVLKSNDNGTSKRPKETSGYSGIDQLGFRVDNLEETTTEFEK